MDPIRLSKRLEEKYLDYLGTMFHFRDPELRASFERALASGRLAKGPFLEGTPVFRRGASLRTMFPQLAGSSADAGLIEAVGGDRPLYLHQQQAVEGATGGHNVVVATGTGSGKTECFLLPILLHLYREWLSGSLDAGVRALVLYPMNALANDQRDRLVEVARRLRQAGSKFEFTFGQYIGETPEDEKDADRHARDHMRERQPGELVLRSEMRRTPPHILLTNYSMLEYLLLRPADSDLFDHGRARAWTFLVLDEAHQYRGSRGIEMAMLLRRLKRRLREGGKEGTFRCIGTSASLAQGNEGRTPVARFAQQLFGEPFNPEYVILGDPEPVPAPGGPSLTAKDYTMLLGAFGPDASNAGAVIGQSATRLRIASALSGTPAQQVGHVLKHDARATAVRRAVTGRPKPVEELAREVFAELGEEERVDALSTLVQLLVLARDPETGAPLLSARYHLFLRALEGAFVSYSPRREVFLERGGGEGVGPRFEVALCRECGQHYFVSRKPVRDGKLAEPLRDPNEVGFGVAYLRPVDAPPEAGEEAGIRRLCMECGELSSEEPSCGHANSLMVVEEPPPDDEERADQMARCGACNYHAAGRDPVREVVHGTDGPNAVMATTLYTDLPEDRKKILAFADNRQAAAYFAWYLEDSYGGILCRRLILDCVRRAARAAPGGSSISDLARDLRDDLRSHRIVKSNATPKEVLSHAYRLAYREFLTDEPRVSLEGVGLVRWTIELPDWIPTPRILTQAPWSLDHAEARQLTRVLVESLRTDRAIELRCAEGISLAWSDLELDRGQVRARIGEKKAGPHEVLWDGKSGRRAYYMESLLRRLNPRMQPEEARREAVRTLDEIWKTLVEGDDHAPSADERLLLSLGDGRRLNPDWWRLTAVGVDEATWRCEMCGRIQGPPVRGTCVRYRCAGSVRGVPAADIPPNHYRSLYEERLPGALRVEEHTAQLDHEKAREFQREFKEGKIHVLSCSTTFELGVDLGDLDTIFLRNVPPESFNYAQRVGRAGRRAGHPGFALTYCPRRPHDLYHFTAPDRILSGAVRAPALVLQNATIVLRHVAAVALSEFFRTNKDRFESVQALLGDFSAVRCCADMRMFLSQHRARIEEALRDVVPEQLWPSIGLADGSWVDRVAGTDSRLAQAEVEVKSDYDAVVELERESNEARSYDVAKWAKDRAETIAGEDVLSFLSRRVVIPKYGFPVDVVELDLQRIRTSREVYDVSLQRDLSIAISEYAPTSKVLANKRLWTSYGLKRVAGKEWEKKSYVRCAQCNVFEQWSWDPKREPPRICAHKSSSGTYVKPTFGFMTERKPPEVPTARPARLFSTRPYFVSTVGPDRGVVPMPPRSSSPLLVLHRATPGIMVVLCEGRKGKGFFICPQCGAGFRKRERRHRSPLGRNCEGTLEPMSLGHEIQTDVLELRFSRPVEPADNPPSVALGLAYALMEGAAEVLEVPSSDLSATVRHSTEPLPFAPIVLYDNVPGGAGLVSRLEDEDTLLATLRAAKQRVAGGCNCGEETSCYGCLRSFRNQFAHQQLARGPVHRYLLSVLAGWGGPP